MIAVILPRINLTAACGTLQECIILVLAGCLAAWLILTGLTILLHVVRREPDLDP